MHLVLVPMAKLALLQRFRRLLSPTDGDARRVWATGAGRVHIETRDLNATQAAALAARVCELEAAPGVRWARFNAPLHRIVVEYGPPQTQHTLMAHVTALEVELGIADVAFARSHPERYPGDDEPVTRTLIELAADGLGLAGSVAFRRLRVPHAAAEVYLAVLSLAARHIPDVRKRIERQLTIPLAELSFELLTAMVQALLQGELGPAASITHRVLRLRELHARRELWQRAEADLCASPDGHVARAPLSEARPVPLPRGPLERYTDRAVFGSLGAFVSALVATRKVESASAALFGGLPKPARYGRDAFASHLDTRLAAEGILVMEPHVLRHLDRVDTIVLDRDSVADTPALDTDMHVIVAPADAATVQELQRRGAAVCVIAGRDCTGLDVADVAIGLVTGNTVPWSAHILCPAGMSDASLVIAAMPAARTAARHGVRLAMAEVGLGIALTASGLRRETVRSIRAGADATTLVAIANGVRLAHKVRRTVLAHTRDEPPWHALSSDAVIAELGSSRAGLSEATAAGRRRVVPPPPHDVVRFGTMVAAELANPMTAVLAAAAGLSVLSGARVDAAMIASVLVTNGILGGAQRWRTERAVSRLDGHGQRTASVVREGQPADTLATELVPGDIVQLVAGDVVPADCRIIEARDLEVDESSLTGESLPVRKNAQPCSSPVVAERTSMLYDGTSIAAGRASAVVVAVGTDTEAERALTAAGTPPATGVEQRLDALTRLTIPLAAGGGLAVGAAALLRGSDARNLMSTMTSLSVAAVPEGLPMLATLAQLGAADRLSRVGALVRNPHAVEALGRVDIVCADKTGTLTEGTIALEQVCDGDTAQAVDELDDHHRDVLAAALRASPSTEDGRARLPHLTDRAIVDGARRAGVGSHDGADHWQRLHQLPFAPSRGFHAGLANHNERTLLSVKGAPEIILRRCSHWQRRDTPVPLSDDAVTQLLRRSETLAETGLRVLAVAERVAEHDEPIDAGRINGMSFRGFVCMADPVRATAARAIEQLQRAGVRTIMLTGDHPRTALRIASELGVTNGHAIVSGAELDNYDDRQLDAIIDEVTVFARVTPSQKVRIVQSLQRMGRVVAMTGDGANDAAAIRLADVGIALGGRATAAARHAADMIVTDESIETIVHAVLEGRALWTSVRDAVALLVGGNLGEIGYTVVGSLIDGASPLNSRQLLLLNLITDSAPALAVALRPPTHRRPHELLEEGPESSLGSRLNKELLWRAAVTGTSALVGHRVARLTGTRTRANTVGLVALTTTQLAQTLLAGSRSKVVVATSLGSFAVLMAVVQTPVVSQFFGCRPLGPLGLAQAGLAALAGAGAGALIRRRDRGAQP